MRPVRLLLVLLLLAAQGSRGVVTPALAAATAGPVEGEDAGEADAMAMADPAEDLQRDRPGLCSRRAELRPTPGVAGARGRLRTGFARSAGRRVAHAAARGRSDDPPLRAA